MEVAFELRHGHPRSRADLDRRAEPARNSSAIGASRSRPPAHLGMSTARVVTNSAMTSEIASSAIIISFVNGLLAETSVELRAVAKWSYSMNFSVQRGATCSSFFISGKISAPGSPPPLARAVGPRRSGFKYDSTKVITLVSQMAPSLAKSILGLMANTETLTKETTRRTAAGGGQGGDPDQKAVQFP